MRFSVVCCGVGLKIIPGCPRKREEDASDQTKTKTHMNAPNWRGERSISAGKNNIKHVIPHCGQVILQTKCKQGNPQPSRLALFPTGLNPLLKTNQGGIHHFDSTRHSRELSHLIWIAGSPSPLSVACSKGITNLVVLTLTWLRGG